MPLGEHLEKTQQRKGSAAMSRLADRINDDDGFMVKLRMDSRFDLKDYDDIKSALKDVISGWKSDGKVSTEDFVAFLDLIQCLAGGSRFWSDETALMAEDAELELMEIIHDELEL